MSEVYPAACVLGHRRLSGAFVKCISRDGTLLLSITAPGIGFALTLDGHTWMFDRNAMVVGSLPPPPRHLALHHPENCPGCAEFVVRIRAQGR
jgi:hypothetical protein